MATGLLPNIHAHDEKPEPSTVEPSPVPAEPAYLARLANLPVALPELGDNAPSNANSNTPARSDAARIDQIEHALTILASVVARLARDAQQSRLQLRNSEVDPNAHEERRVQRELVRSMQARLTLMEERLDRKRDELSPAEVLPQIAPDLALQLSTSLGSIRNSLAALAKRRPTALS